MHFKDGGIKRSRFIWPELKQAIWESRVSIVVLSKNYGGSSWCLDELVEIMECKEVSGQTVMPIFYGVDPTDVRKQSGDFGKAFDKICHVRTEEERQRWRQALTSVASIAGDCSSKWDNDAVMIERIVTNVLQELNWCTPSKDFKDLVGLEAHVSNLNSMLCLDSNEVKITAGIGKTTIARALYNQLSSSGDDFQLNIFMENVKGVQMRNELHGYSLKLHLQERFLSEIFNQRTKISHLGVAQERLKNQKALIVLDDVDGLEQLNALVDQAEWFGYGTRIIVTTEDRQLLKAHGINHVYEVGYPSQGEAFKILCRYAFGKNSAPKGFYDLATEVTKLAGDLPDIL